MPQAPDTPGSSGFFNWTYRQLSRAFKFLPSVATPTTGGKRKREVDDDANVASGLEHPSEPQNSKLTIDMVDTIAPDVRHEPDSRPEPEAATLAVEKKPQAKPFFQNFQDLKQDFGLGMPMGVSRYQAGSSRQQQKIAVGVGHSDRWVAEAGNSQPPASSSQPSQAKQATLAQPPAQQYNSCRPPPLAAEPNSVIRPRTLFSQTPGTRGTTGRRLLPAQQHQPYRSSVVPRMMQGTQDREFSDWERRIKSHNSQQNELWRERALLIRDPGKSNIDKSCEDDRNFLESNAKKKEAFRSLDSQMQQLLRNAQSRLPPGPPASTVDLDAEEEGGGDKDEMCSLGARMEQDPEQAASRTPWEHSGAGR
eukprot:gene5957-33533_t